MADFTTGTDADFVQVGTETDPTDGLEQSDFFDELDGDFSDAESPNDQTNYAEPGQGESFAGQDPSIWSIQGNAADGSSFTSSTPAIETETVPTDGDEPESEPLQDDNPAVENEDPQPFIEPAEEPEDETAAETDTVPVEVEEQKPAEPVIEKDEEDEPDDQLILDENTYGDDYEDTVQDFVELAYTGTEEQQEPELDVESEDELALYDVYAELEMLDTENDLMSGEVIFEETLLIEFRDLDDDPFSDSDNDGFIDFTDDMDEGFI